MSNLIKNYDTVNRPKHYAEGREYEPIDVINDWELGFNLGNTVKYISRAGRKNNAIEDLEKAKFYLEYEIKRLKEEIRTCPKCESSQDNGHRRCLNCGYDFNGEVL